MPSGVLPVQCDIHHVNQGVALPHLNLVLTSVEEVKVMNHTVYTYKSNGSEHARYEFDIFFSYNGAMHLDPFDVVLFLKINGQYVNIDRQMLSYAERVMDWFIHDFVFISSSFHHKPHAQVSCSLIMRDHLTVERTECMISLCNNISII